MLYFYLKYSQNKIKFYLLNYLIMLKLICFLKEPKILKPLLKRLGLVFPLNFITEYMQIAQILFYECFSCFRLLFWLILILIQYFFLRIKL